MKIGIDAHNLEGKRTGVGRYLFNLLKEWDRSAANNQQSAIKFILYFKDEIPADLPRSDLFECKLLKVGSTAKFMHWNLARAAKQDKVDILFCPAYVAPIFYKGKIALVLHDISYEAHPGQFNWNSLADRILLKWISRKAARKAEIIFAPSEFSRQEIIKHYRVSPEKVFFVAAASDFDLPTASSVEEIQAVKRKYRINDKFCFFVGSIFSRRHLPEIISAFGRLAAQRPDFQLLLGGKDYVQKNSIANLIARENDSLGRETVIHVDFIGDSDLRSLYSACAFFIWLSDYEGFGLPPLEAMSLGAPVITSDSTSLKEVAGQAALLIKNNSDIEEIYQAMKRLSEDDNLRRQLIEKGKEQARKFSWKKCAEEILKILMNSQ